MTMDLSTELPTEKLTTVEYDESSVQGSDDYYGMYNFFYQTDCDPGDRYCWQRFIYEYNVLYVYFQPVLCCTALLILLITLYVCIKQSSLTPPSIIILCTVVAFAVEESLVTSFQLSVTKDLNKDWKLQPSLLHLTYPLCDVYSYLYEMVAVFDNIQSLLIILLAVQRCIMIKYPFDFKKYVSVKTTIFSILISVSISMGFRVPIIIMSGHTVDYKDYIGSENLTDYGIVDSDRCMENNPYYFTEVYTTIEPIAFELAPAFILLSTTVFIIHKLRTQMQNFKNNVNSFDQRKLRTRKATINVVIISTVFLTFHLLGSIIYLLLALVPDTRVADDMFIFMTFANIFRSILKQVVMVTYVQSGEKNKQILLGLFCIQKNKVP